MPVENAVHAVSDTPCCTHIAPAKLVDHRCADVFGQNRNFRNGDRKGREEHELHKAAEVVLIADIVSGRKQMQHQSEDPHEQNTQEKAGEGNPQHGEEIDELLNDRVLLARREDAQRNGRCDDKNNGHQAEQYRGRQTAADQIRHRHGIADGRAGIAGEQSRNPVAVLHEQRQVCSQRVPELLQLFRGGLGAQNEHGGVSRNDMERCEGQQRNGEHRRQQYQRFSNQIAHRIPV